MFHKFKKSMRNFFIVISLFYIFSGSILSASDFNYDTGSALKSDLANNATITAMHLYRDKILAVGVHGIILSSKDMGLTWTQAENVPFTNTLTDVQCVTESQCWAVGHDLTILHSVDGGKNWSIQFEDKDFDAPFLSIHMIDYLNGIVVGAFAQSLTTSDGGENWSSTVVTDDAYEPHLNSVYSSNIMKSEIGNDLMFVAGEIGQVHISNDQGESWNMVDTEYFGSLWGGISVDQKRKLLLGMAGKILYLKFNDETLNDFSLDTIFAGIKNSLTDIKKLNNGNYIVSGNGGVVTIIDLDNETTETCIRGDRLSNTSVIEVSNDKYLLSGEKGFRAHSMRECQSNFEDKNSISKDMWMKSEFQYEEWVPYDWQ
ncbi:YCF48-related protein [Pelagibacteraceae bacterium]|nr:YCF48-related protein [Pelagibacteraceae bacterium]